MGAMVCILERANIINSAVSCQLSARSHEKNGVRRVLSWANDHGRAGGDRGRNFEGRIIVDCCLHCKQLKNRHFYDGYFRGLQTAKKAERLKAPCSLCYSLARLLIAR
jgi:hypothetical protein